MTNEVNNNPDSGDDEVPSKTRRKKEMIELQNLGEHLTEIPQYLLDKCDLPESLLHAIGEYKRLPNKRGAKKRQLQFIGRIMRDIDPEPITRVLEAEGQQTELEKRRFHRLEATRDQLIAGDTEVLNELIATCPDLDIQYVRQLIRQAAKESTGNKTPAARKLFVYLRKLPEV